MRAWASKSLAGHLRPTGADSGGAGGSDGSIDWDALPWVYVQVGRWAAGLHLCQEGLGRAAGGRWGKLPICRLPCFSGQSVHDPGQSALWNRAV